MPGAIVPRRRFALAAAALGALALVPSVVLIVAGVSGAAVPRLLSHPILVLGGIAVALVANIGASINLRSQATADEVTLECDVRVRYRGVNRTVLLVAGTLAFIILGYLLVENLGHARLSP